MSARARETAQCLRCQAGAHLAGTNAKRSECLAHELAGETYAKLDLFCSGHRGETFGVMIDLQGEIDHRQTLIMADL